MMTINTTTELNAIRDVIDNFKGKIFTSSDYATVRGRTNMPSLETLRKYDWAEIVRTETFVKVDRSDLDFYDLTEEEYLSLPIKVKDRLSISAYECKRYYYQINASKIKNDLKTMIHKHTLVATAIRWEIQSL